MRIRVSTWIVRAAVRVQAWGNRQKAHKHLIGLSPTLLGFIIRGVMWDIPTLLGFSIRGGGYMGYPYPCFCLCAFLGALNGGAGL